MPVVQFVVVVSL